MDLAHLKNEEYQHYLSEIATIKDISFIISLDHIKTSGLWNDQMLDKYNFYCIQVDTF